MFEVFEIKIGFYSLNNDIKESEILVLSLLSLFIKFSEINSLKTTNKYLLVFLINFHCIRINLLHGSFAIKTISLINGEPRIY